MGRIQIGPSGTWYDEDELQQALNSMGLILPDADTPLASLSDDQIKRLDTVRKDLDKTRRELSKLNLPVPPSNEQIDNERKLVNPEEAERRWWLYSSIQSVQSSFLALESLIDATEASIEQLMKAAESVQKGQP